MKALTIVALAAMLILSLATPAFAAGFSDTGSDYGLHHATHAQEMDGFTGTMNPGVMHQGLSGWPGV